MKNKSILALDPGESTGWCFLGRDNTMQAGTLLKNHVHVATLIDKLQPDLVIFESFNLYPSKAKSLAWNSFYPCEVIGVIKCKCTIERIDYLQQAPSVKKYAGPLPQQYKDLAKQKKLTEHSKDACQHLCYYLRRWKLIDRVFDSTP